MKAIIVLAVLLIASTALAVNPGRVGFKTYSSASNARCVVYGSLPGKTGGTIGFNPYSSFSRTLSLGTKGYANYSTIGRGQIYFTCTVNGTTGAIPVKIQWKGFLNGIEKHFLTLTSGTFVTE